LPKNKKPAIKTKIATEMAANFNNRFRHFFASRGGIWFASATFSIFYRPPLWSLWITKLDFSPKTNLKFILAFSMNQRQTSKALAHLSRDPKMRRLIKVHSVPQWPQKTNLFADLVESIIGQQLSEKAASTISSRFRKLFGKKSFPSPQEVARARIARLRKCGISRAKASSIKGIARAFVKKEIHPQRLKKLSDEEVIAELTKLKGIGRWTAEMILMFTLGRHDVFSVGDLGLRQAVAQLYKVDQDDHKKIVKIAERWRPYRTLASRYLWRSLGEKE